MIVLDASAAAPALIDDGPDGQHALGLLVDEVVVVPELFDLEVTAVVRGVLRSGRMTVRRAEQAIEELVLLPIRRVSHARLLRRVWELRDNVSVYDATYVALAEAIDAPLVTADKRLARAPGLRCEVRVVS